MTRIHTRMSLRKVPVRSNMLIEIAHYQNNEQGKTTLIRLGEISWETSISIR